MLFSYQNPIIEGTKEKSSDKKDGASIKGDKTMLLETHVLTENTYALIPAKEIDASTIVMEDKQETRVRTTPLEIIKQSCIHHWSTYEGRRTAVIDHLQFKQKTPIPISIAQKICFFPTHSPTHADNHWINFAQIAKWGEVTHQGRKRTQILWINGDHLTLDISRHTLQTQIERAFQVMHVSGMVGV